MTKRTRAAIVAGAAALGGAAYLLSPVVGPRGRAAAGAVCFVLLVAAASRNVHAVRWRAVLAGFGLQLLLAVAILKLDVGGVRPGYALFTQVAAMVARFLEFTSAGSELVFGGLADPTVMDQLFPGGLVLAFTALPTIIFISSFFTVLYYFGILQFLVQMMARAMVHVMGTSGAETLSAVANVFMGQTEAPIIVKPYIPGMTQSELLALMVGGMATIAGGVMAVYIGMGADPIAVLTTSVMAAPGGLALAKLMLPEMEEPATRGAIRLTVERTHVNAIDAAAAGATDGTVLAINVAAMLIVFMAFIAMFDFLLGLISPGLSLAQIFAWVFAPVAFLMGVPTADVPAVADLLGTKLVANEFVAFAKLTEEYQGVISERAFVLSSFALTGFANIASVGVQLGGIGSLAPSRRSDLAQLGMRALFVGFLATMLNAAVAAVLL